jgi:D-hexose-6-phosphate mutarotase
MKTEELNEKFGATGSVEFSDGPGGMPRVLITTAAAVAEVSLYGAQVLAFVPRGQRDLLWVSGKSRFERGRAIRGGIPVCWPWFGDHPDDADKPAHGFARISEWNVVDVALLGTDTIRLILELQPSELSRELWNYEFETRLSVTVGNELEVALTTRNIGCEPLPITAALHSYFNISDIANVTLQGLEQVSFVDMLTQQEQVEAEPLRICGETDRAYLGHSDAVLIHDSGWGRTIRVDKRGSESAVVWNPWVDKSRRMADFGDDEFHRMVCVETTNTHSDAREVSPGGEHTLATIISIVE